MLLPFPLVDFQHVMYGVQTTHVDIDVRNFEADATPLVVPTYTVTTQLKKFCEEGRFAMPGPVPTGNTQYPFVLPPPTIWNASTDYGLSWPPPLGTLQPETFTSATLAIHGFTVPVVTRTKVRVFKNIRTTTELFGREDPTDWKAIGRIHYDEYLLDDEKTSVTLEAEDPTPGDGGGGPSGGM